MLDIWRPIQNEVRTIGRSYLTDETHHSVDQQQLMSMNEIIKDGKIARNKTKVSIIINLSLSSYLLTLCIRPAC